MQSRQFSDLFEALVEGFRTLLQDRIAVAQRGKCIDYRLAHGHVAAVLATIRSIGLEDRLGLPAALAASTILQPSSEIRRTSETRPCGVNRAFL